MFSIKNIIPNMKMFCKEPIKYVEWIVENMIQEVKKAIYSLK